MSGQLTKLPDPSTLVDQQAVQVTGPDGLLTDFQYDVQTRALYLQENQLAILGHHGITHITSDPIPTATDSQMGLMSADDKAKLDAMLQTRVGVLGFMGAGFPDDGGWMSGDIILAAGSDFISIERVGNLVKISVDSPLPLSPDCEGCRQLFWVRDETAPSAIRPPTCNGKLPDVNTYGEIRFFLMPASTLVDPTNPSNTLNKKGNYPALLFTRYQNTVTPGLGEFDLVLKRNANNKSQTDVGWSMTPGPSPGNIPQCVWFMGLDSAGNLIRFDLTTNQEPGLLGALLYKGHLLTRQMAVITSYAQAVLANNQYNCKLWDVLNQRPVGDEFVATNLWRYADPNNPTTLVPEGTIGVLPLGTLVELYWYQIALVAGTPIRRYFFTRHPPFNPAVLWDEVGSIQFGDQNVARQESGPGDPRTAWVVASLSKDFEPTIWGLSSRDEPLYIWDFASGAASAGAPVNTEHRAVVDTSLPGLRVLGDTGSADVQPFNERPVLFWNRQHLAGNILLRAEIGRPQVAAAGTTAFPPYDVMMNTPFDFRDNIYMRVVEVGQTSAWHFIRVKGVHFRDLPDAGTVRIINPTTSRNLIFPFFHKFMYPQKEVDSVILANSVGVSPAYPGAVSDILELLPVSYSGPMVRVQFSTSGAAINLQLRVGILDQSQPYEFDNPQSPLDDYVRGLTPGFTVSAVYSQATHWDGTGTPPSSNIPGFAIVDGGFDSSGIEHWNALEIMWRNGEIWVWWNGLLLPPSPSLSAALPTPVQVGTPFFPIDIGRRYGKSGLRMWQGATLRRFELRSQPRVFSELTYGSVTQPS